MAYQEKINRDKKLRSEFKKKLKGLINITGLFRKLDADTYWWPEDIVELELIDDTTPGYCDYQHARIVGDESKKLYMRISEDEVRGVNHYYVYQRSEYLGDDYSGWMLFPLKNGKYFKVIYNC